MTNFGCELNIALGVSFIKIAYTLDQFVVSSNLGLRETLLATRYGTIVQQDGNNSKGKTDGEADSSDDLYYKARKIAEWTSMQDRSD
jgi:hypothetical protein